MHISPFTLFHTSKSTKINIHIYIYISNPIISNFQYQSRIQYAYTYPNPSSIPSYHVTPLTTHFRGFFHGFPPSAHRECGLSSLSHPSTDSLLLNHHHDVRKSSPRWSIRVLVTFQSRLGLKQYLDLLLDQSCLHLLSLPFSHTHDKSKGGAGESKHSILASETALSSRVLSDAWFQIPLWLITSPPRCSAQILVLHPFQILSQIFVHLRDHSKSEQVLLKVSTRTMVSCSLFISIHF